MTLPEHGPEGGDAWVIVARASVTAASDRELQGLCERLHEHLNRLSREQPEPPPRARPADVRAQVRYAYTEQGEPALRQVLHELADARVARVRLLPMLLPMEPGTSLTLQRVIRRWQAQRGDGRWPTVHIGPAPSSTAAIGPLLAEMAVAARRAAPCDTAGVTDAEGATVPTQRHRVLVCAGPACTDTGANLVWGHLRNIQKARNLRTEGPGVMTCKTTCLGPCALGPVLQVWPDGTWYGGVDEAAVERIVDEHLLGGQPVAAFAYAPQPRKQVLRQPAPRSGPRQPG
jgi:(2Fe-2S) ferredoxin